VTPEDVVLKWKYHPDQFVRDVFQVVPEKWQDEALLNLVANDRVSIKSGHGVGKSCFLA